MAELTARGSGRTTKQMTEAPKGAVFVWCNGSLSYPIWLAHKLERRDLEIVTPQWLNDYRYVGKQLKGLVIDHALFTALPQMTEAQRNQLEYHIQRAETLIRMRPSPV